MAENKEELSFMPSAVSSSAGWHEPNFCVTGNVGEKGFKYNDIASVMVEDHGEHKINVCKNCHNLRHGERKEPIVNSRLWKLLVAEKRSRGKLAAGLGGRGLEQKIMNIEAAKKIYAKNLLKDSEEVTGLGQSVAGGVAIQEGGLFAGEEDDGAESDQGGWSGRVRSTPG